MASHKSIVAYLNSIKLPNSAAALREELSIGDTFDDVTSKKYEGLLEKKWTSVVRLQKKVNMHRCSQATAWANKRKSDNGPRIT